jgi:uncharacterized integral membrane protein
MLPESSVTTTVLTMHERTNMMNPKLILVLLLSSLAVIFIAQNVAVVEIGFLFWRASISSALLIFFALLMGFVLGWSTHVYLLYRRTKDELSFYRRT